MDPTQYFNGKYTTHQFLERCLVGGFVQVQSKQCIPNYLKLYKNCFLLRLDINHPQVPSPSKMLSPSQSPLSLLFWKRQI